MAQWNSSGIKPTRGKRQPRTSHFVQHVNWGVVHRSSWVLREYRNHTAPNLVSREGVEEHTLSFHSPFREETKRGGQMWGKNWQVTGRPLWASFEALWTSTNGTLSSLPSSLWRLSWTRSPCASVFFFYVYARPDLSASTVEVASLSSVENPPRSLCYPHSLL